MQQALGRWARLEPRRGCCQPVYGYPSIWSTLACPQAAACP